MQRRVVNILTYSTELVDTKNPNPDQRNTGVVAGTTSFSRRRRASQGHESLLAKSWQWCRDKYSPKSCQKPHSSRSASPDHKPRSSCNRTLKVFRPGVLERIILGTPIIITRQRWRWGRFLSFNLWW